MPHAIPPRCCDPSSSAAADALAADVAAKRMAVVGALPEELLALLHDRGAVCEEGEGDRPRSDAGTRDL